MTHVEVKPELLRWARERGGIGIADLARRFPKLAAWERGRAQPTLNQLEDFAKATHTPVGFLFLKEPPVEAVPIPDFRTVGNRCIARPSPDLLDTVYICQQRQEWYCDFSRSMGEGPLPFVGSARVTDAIDATATTMRQALRFDLNERQQLPTWTDALRRFIEQADAIGVLVMCSSVVQNNNHRHLDPEEFRGFAMSDPLAPLVFINGADTKAAQMFTLAHELAHIWLGQSALSDTQVSQTPDHQVEGWCNRVAAELLVPLAVLRAEYIRRAGALAEMNRLARCFKVSTLVILRRIYDAGEISQQQFWKAYRDEVERLSELPRGSGGNFYLTQAVRVSKRFARALVVSTLEGQTLYRDAFQLLGIRKEKTFAEFGARFGVIDGIPA
jgi:Zn-dependent peptidase ImmA (M78 family)